MSAASETLAKERHILLVGPYSVLGTGVVDAVAENSRASTRADLSGPGRAPSRQR